MYNKHYPSILVTFFVETEHFSGKNGAFWWSILVGKQKHNVQKPTRKENGRPKPNHPTVNKLPKLTQTGSVVKPNTRRTLTQTECLVSVRLIQCSGYLSTSPYTERTTLT